MIERLFVWNGHLSTLLMIAGLVTSWWWPAQPAAATLLYAGLLLLMVTPVTRVVAACTRYVAEGDRLSASLTAAILVVIAISVWVAAGK
ncbi:MAG: DUF1634 domain-containing protein [Acidobacteria bacterium]|nr:DUF1634 domain-containing protein [Acidobacteriota bacterium]